MTNANHECMITLVTIDKKLATVAVAAKEGVFYSLNQTLNFQNSGQQL